MGHISLDHVYEFTGGLSLTVKTVTGTTGCLYGRLPQPDQPPHAGCQRGHCRRDTFHCLEPYLYTRADERREGSAQMFGEIFRNIFGWHVMRPSAMDKELFNDLYRMYIKDENKLGIHEYFLRVNPAAFQAMTAVMLESARKGYWKASDEQLKTTASLHAQITREKVLYRIRLRQ